MKKDLITTIEITDSHVKCIQGKATRQGCLVTACDIKEIHEPNDSHISRLLKEISFAKTIPAGIIIAAIPRRFILLKHLSLPSHQEDEIRRMVSLQIVDKIPYNREDIVLEFLVLKKDPSGYSDVLVIVVHKDVLQRCWRILSDAGMTPHKMIFSSLGVVEWFMSQPRHAGAASQQTAVIVNIDDINSEICFCHQGQLMFSRHIHYGAKDLHEEHILAFLQQIELTIETYQQQVGPDIHKVIIVSSVPHSAQLKDQLKEETKMDAELMTPLDNLPCEKSFQLGALWAKKGVSVSVGIGLLLSHQKKLTNLVLPEIRHTAQTQLKQRELTRFVMMILTTAILCGSIFAVDLYKQTRYLKLFENRIKKIKPEFDKAQQKILAFEFVKDQLTNRVHAVDLINELYNLIPAEISLRSVILNSAGQLNIQGFGKTSASVNLFQSRMVGSNLFKDVTLQYATQRYRFNQEVTDFKFSCQMAKIQSLVKINE